MNRCRILVGDALVRMRDLPDESVHTCVTSPPYWGLRSYLADGVRLKVNAPTSVITELESLGIKPIDHKSDIPAHLQQWFEPAELGAEATPEAYVARLVAVFAQVRRVLRDDGTLWLNLGDSYASRWPCRRPERSEIGAGSLENGKREARPERMGPGLKDKDLVGIPWRVAFALQADGWYLRSDIIWHKPNPMPESVLDRPTKSHEYIFLLSKSERYAYDAEAIKEPMVNGEKFHGNYRPETPTVPATVSARNGRTDKQRGHARRHDGFNDRWDAMEHDEQRTGMRNKRDVWTVSPAQFGGDHFATFPEELIAPCVLAGCVEGGTVLDPFGGAGTTGLVAVKRGRNAVLIELNPRYAEMARARIAEACPLFADVSVEKPE